ncbi:phosphatidylinositol 4-phosphate 3-kinase C2 domain-containing subunit gamma [Protopterus annectens]|uniref:phosphatidylinositol 4-phosphate 3-kinase C2 domain-containing subunit gamma n=1 Tax=Protopterus annectens TaxID=7888 RepID=UPI001CF99663|nr:phosphatidylinositol 4-phosphate 3-kinase C2 domain-containing subunit gamma [Protopterus annectens]
MKTEDKAIGKALFSCIKWNKQIRFPLEIRKLPYETMLVLQLFGTSTSSQTTKPLAWTVLPLYNKKIFAYGTRLLNMIPQSDLPSIFAPGLLDTSQPTGFVLQVSDTSRAGKYIFHYMLAILLSKVDASLFSFELVCFPETNRLVFEKPSESSEKLPSQEENEVCCKQIMNISQKYSLLLVSEEEQALLWAIRSFHLSSKGCLPLMVGSAPNWNLDSLPEIYTLLKKWNPCHPSEALAFLTASFPDQEVRRTAVLELESLSSDELIEYLPQLIQAIKTEWDLESPLVKLLLERSLQSVRFAHHFYWLLNSALDEAHFQSWYQKVLAALQFCIGESLNDEFTTEKKLMKALAEVAKKVRAADDSKRQEILKKEIDKCQQLFPEGRVCRLPLNPALAVRGIDIEDCSYFHSKTVPLKISLFNADLQSKNISVILKTGDDLRQDMIVLQIARVMNRIWLQEGLDLQMIIYQCLSTGEGQGMVELVKDATTLAKIHSKSGIIGPLKEDTLEKWFRHHNPTKAGYEKALYNFLHSCAGWCIVTFIMGVCDRHNDNIMLKPSGHMFHIDFGKFLGNAEMIGAIRRDRAPFIFTTEMEYFITTGGKEPHRFQEFVELCCQAYNHVRRHSQLLMNLLELMLSSGMPELKYSQDLRYVVENLRPWDSDLEATSYFTRKIKESLDCFPVRLNNLIHILANMSTTMNSKKEPSKQDLQSMLPKSGYIREATIIGFATKPECLYAVKVVCENEIVVMAHKTFTQFYEFHNRLRQLFPALPLPEFPVKRVFYLGDLCAKRLKELNAYLELLFSETYEAAASHELVKSFFLEEMSTKSNEKPAGVLNTNKKPEVQLLISFVDNKLSILVKHLRNIVSSDGSAPDAYVEIYLLPDTEHITKRKTKAVPKSRNPAYNEIIEYTGIARLDDHVLKLIVKNKGSFLAAVNLTLSDIPLDKDKWYPLCNSEV